MVMNNNSTGRNTDSAIIWQDLKKLMELKWSIYTAADNACVESFFHC